jgi:putative endonuclease
MDVSVYILYSEKGDHYYIGQSDDPVRRQEFHNSAEKGYTSRFRPWRLVYTRKCGSRREARTLEKIIKGWKNKQKVIRLVKREIEL